MEIQTEHLYVVRNKSILNGEPIIKGTRTPVRAIVEWWRMGIAPEEIPIKLPHLSLARVFDALSYYCEHTDEILMYIEQNRTPEYMIEPLVRHVNRNRVFGKNSVSQLFTEDTMMKHIIFICACLLMMIIPGALSIADGLWPDDELPKPPVNVDFYGSISVKGESAHVGWILRAFDQNGVQCGEFKIGVEGEYGLLHAYGDDIYTPEDEGALPGELVIFKVWDTTGKAHIVRPNGLDIPIWSEDGDYKEIELMTKYGDMSGDGNVTAFDASIILRAVVGSIKFGSEERENADVTANGTVTALDAAVILQKTVGLIEKFPAELEQEEAVKATPADIQTYALSIPSATIHPGMKITVPIVTDSTSGMLGAQLSLVFDSELLKPINVYLASSMTGYLLEYRVINDQLNIAIASPRTSNDNGAIINVEFEVSNKINRNITSHIVLSRQLLNEGANVSVKNGSFKILPAKTLMYPNYPNPFNPETWIPYQLAEESDVNIRIYDVTGRLVYRVNLGNQNAGFYLTKGEAIHWDGKDNAGEKVASGVYFYTLEAGRFRATRKMILMK